MYQDRLKYLIIVWLTTFAMVLHAQNEEIGTTKKVKSKREFNPVNQMVPVETSGVDTLTILDRIALRTNLVDWALMIPNIGAEFDVKKTNWNRWTVGFNVRYNWQTDHTYTQFIVYNLLEARLEARQYFRARQIGRRGLEKHKYLWDKAISIRRKRVKHPATTWYRGVFVSYDKYSFLIPNRGHQGTAYMAGVSYGFVRPMFAFSNGNSIDLEFGISGGALYYKDQEYTHDVESDCYPIVKSNPGKLLKFPMLNELRVGLIYRLGHHPVLSKYRYRRDVDEAYDLRKDSIHTAHVTKRQNHREFKHNYDDILRKFWHVYDSIASVDKARRTLLLDNMMPKDSIVYDKKGRPKKVKVKVPKQKKVKIEKPRIDRPKKEKTKKEKKDKGQKGGGDA